MFEKLKARRAAEAAKRSAASAQAESARAEAAWREADARFAWCIDRTREVVSGAGATADVSLPLKSGERALYEADGIGLVEPKRGPGHWQGGSQAVSIRVPGTKSMRYRVGGTRGTYVQGDEHPSVIDTGTLTITTARAAFVGAQQSREWAWAKLIGFHEDDPPTWTGIAVSNRQKVSGVSCPADQVLPVRFFLELAVAVANGHAEELLHDLETQRAEHATARGANPAP
jgi:hypothetical protein